jgi:hypothetical protein
LCLSCYWAYPENYSHIATRAIRRIDLIWQGEDITMYEKLKTEALSSSKGMPEFVKDIIARELSRHPTQI